MTMTLYNVSVSTVPLTTDILPFIPYIFLKLIPHISRHLSLSYLLSSQDPIAIGECKHSLRSLMGIIPI